jgi:outer membrane lipoprotein SlyB
MRFRLLIPALLAMTISLPGAYAGEDTGAAADRPAGGVASLITVNATVTSINHETREVTLKGADGKEIAITVGEEVKNLPQVEVGDEVQIAYYEAVDFQVLGKGETEPAAAAISALETAPSGQKPSGSMSTTQSIVATIEAIDKDNQTVTLKGPMGNSRTVKARNPENLEKVAVGDRVLITVTNAVAVDVTESSPAE